MNTSSYDSIDYTNHFVLYDNQIWYCSKERYSQFHAQILECHLYTLSDYYKKRACSTWHPRSKQYCTLITDPLLIQCLSHIKKDYELLDIKTSETINTFINGLPKDV